MTTATLSYYVATWLTTMLLGVAIIFAFFRIDDVLFDLIFWVSWLKRWQIRRRYAPFSPSDLMAAVEQRVAIFIPCWHESEIVDKMLEYASRHINYRRYDILIGVYPNDESTVDKVRSAARRYRGVHAVINDIPGPTTKAQNLNSIYRAMKRIEGDDPFSIVLIHDVEDVIHPLSLRLYNHLIPGKQMVQIPVFPLERRWTSSISWTYADEFARSHLKDMILRERLGSFVPSAGVGTAFSREALERVAETSDDLFPEGSLTEDYQIGLRLHECGLKTVYVNKRLSPESRGRSSTAAAYVATREFFPNRFRDAVRQKARWVAGICLQSWDELGWIGDWATRYMLYRDRRAILTNIFALVGWITLVAAFAMRGWEFFDDQVFVPSFGTQLWRMLLLDFVVAMTFVELIQTACFVSWLYGPTQGLLSMLRAPLAAVINGFATIRALYLFLASFIKHEPMTWSKTHHAFPSDEALREFRRQLGEVLIERRQISRDQLTLALAEQARAGERLGATLLRLGYIDSAELTEALAAQGGFLLMGEDEVVFDPAFQFFGARSELQRMRAVPIRIIADRVLVAIDRVPSDAELAELFAIIGTDVVAQITSHTAIDNAFEQASRAYR